MSQAALAQKSYAETKKEKKPNIVIIMADDLGWRDLASQRPDIVEKLQDLLAASPVGASTSIPLRKVILDPDEFGGAERKAPMADLALE